MAKILNSVIHFQGSEINWKNNIVSGIWTDNIVFGIITDSNTGKISKRVYAGRNTRGVDYEYKNAISVNSLESAQDLATENNIGLIITIANNQTTDKNGTYIVSYNSDNEVILLDISNSVEALYWDDEIEPINIENMS